MKKVMIIVIFVCLGIFVSGQGIEFRKLNFKEALEQAGKENKYVFMDCYTSWCGPCRYMNDNIFPAVKVGAFFNPKFVCVKYDMSTSEMKEVGEKYNVHAYPTYLILKPDGTLYHKITGSRDVDEFVEVVKRGMNKKHSLSYLKALHEKGKMSKEELRRYAVALKEASEKEKCLTIQNELMTRLSDKEKLEGKYWILFENKEFGDNDYDFVVKNLKTFQANVGKSIVDNFLIKNYEKLERYYMVRLQNGSMTNFAEPFKIVNEAYQELSGIEIEGKERMVERLMLLKAYLGNNTREVINAFENILTSKGGNQSMMYRIIGIIKKRDNQSLMEGMIYAKERLLSLVPDVERKKLAREIDGFQKFIDNTNENRVRD